MFRYAILLVLCCNYQLPKANAAAPNLDIANCRSISDNTLRLLCYDNLYPVRVDVAPTASKSNADVARIVSGKADCDIKNLFDNIYRHISKKSDFETQQAYAARRDADVLRSGQKISDLFCELYGDQPPPYDAEKGGYNIFLHGLTKHEPEVLLGTYDSQNGFGVKVTVRKTSRKNWEMDSAHIVETISVPMNALRAEQNKSNYRAGIIVDIVTPCATIEEYSTRPTISIPEEASVVSNKLRIKYKYLVIFDKTNWSPIWSGKIVYCKSPYSSSQSISLEKCPK